MPAPVGAPSSGRPTGRAPRRLLLVARSTAARAALLGGVGAVVGGIGIGTPSYWGDEAASVMSAERSFPSLLAQAGHVDAVHTTYYAFLHLWVGLFGTSEIATRTPSAIAVGFLVAGVVVIGERLGGIRLGVAAGVAAILLPRITYMATEARSYAFAAAAATWIMVLAVRLLRGRHRRWEWIALGAAIGAAAWIFLYTVLLVVVVAVVLLVLRRDLLRSWLWTLGVAAVVAAPIGIVAISQHAQIEFLAHRSMGGIGGVLVSQWFIRPAPAIVGWVLIAAGIGLSLWRRRGRRVVLVGVVWAALPTLALLALDLRVPVYSSRYLSFAAPAVALLMGLGVVRIMELVRGRLLQLTAGGAVLAVAAATAAPVYLSQRGPFGQPGGADFRQTAQAVGRLAHPGDAVVFTEGIRPSISPRLAYRLYPQEFRGLRDVELDTPFLQRAGLWDTVRPLDEVVPQLGDEVIAVERTSSAKPFRQGAQPAPLRTTPADIRRLTELGYRVDARIHLNVDTVYRLVRAPS